MNKNASLREKVNRWKLKIMLNTRLWLDKEVKHAGNWIPIWSGGTLWKVEHIHTRNSFIVDTSKKHTLVTFEN